MDGHPVSSTSRIHRRQRGPASVCCPARVRRWALPLHLGHALVAGRGRVRPVVLADQPGCSVPTLIEIRDGTAGDAAWMAALLRMTALFDLDHGALAASQHVDPTYLRENLVRVAVRGQDLLGFAGLRFPDPHDGSAAALDCVVIGVAYRHHGVRALLMDDLHVVANTRGIRIRPGAHPLLHRYACPIGPPARSALLSERP